MVVDGYFPANPALFGANSAELLGLIYTGMASSIPNLTSAY